MSWTTESASDQTPEAVVARVSWNRDGLLPAIIQDDADGAVLMLGYMDDEALRRTLSEGRVTFWSRSRQEYWRKGDTSGHRQYVKTAALDCDGDTLLVRVEQLGPACHTGARACFDVDPLEPVVGSAADDAEFPESAPADPAAAPDPVAPTSAAPLDDTAGESTE